MSILANSALLTRLRKGDLVVSPLISDKQVGASSIDLRMGTVALLVRAGMQSHVDPKGYRTDSKAEGNHDNTRFRQQKHQRFDVAFGGFLLLHPGALVLVPTLEWVKLPNDLQGVVTARSSWAREGLSIATATIINPGYQGIITLELANLGEVPIRLYPGLRLAQLALCVLSATDSAADEAKLQEGGQFNMSFEPIAGNISKDDEIFIPSDKGQ